MFNLQVVITYTYTEKTTMNNLLKFSVIFLIVSAATCQGAPLSSEQKEKLGSYHKQCLKESNVNEITVDNARKGIYIDDSNFKKYLYCFSQKVGFQDDKGVVQKDVFQKKISTVVTDEAVLQKLVKQCTVEKKTPEDTSFSIATCLREVSPDIEIFKIAPNVVYLSNEEAQAFLIKHKECAADDKLGAEVIENAREKGVLFEDPKFKSYIYCISKKAGFQNEDGSVNKEGFKKFNKVIDDSAVLEKIIEKCTVQQDTPENTAFFISRCINENSPVYVEVFPREIPVSDEVAKEIIAYGRACLKETGVDRQVVFKTRDGIYSDDPKLKEFALCMALKSGIMKSNGDFETEKLRTQTMKLLKDPVVVQKLIDQCAIKKDSPLETAFFSNMCFFKNSPGHLSITQFGALSEAKKENARKIIKECSEKTGVSKSVVFKARTGDFQDDPLLKEYFFCIQQKSGVINEAGEFNQNNIKMSLTEMFNQEEAEKIMEKCIKMKDSPVNTSFESFRCFYTEAPEAECIF